MRLPALHLVTDDGVLAAPRFAETARTLLEAGGPAVALHVRGHGTPVRVLHGLTEALAPAARESGALLLVNDRVDVALAAGADGVQLGRRSIPLRDGRALLGAEAVLGYSAHAGEEARSAVEAGADFVVLGSVFETPSHPGAPGAGLGLLGEPVGAPRIAIGGIGPERVAEVLTAGAQGVAVLSGVWRTADPARAVARYLAALEEHG